MIPKVLSIVDVETTGLSSQNGRIIEIGILRIEQGKVVEEFSSLINPQTYVDPFILSMTGILQGELENAPSFYEVSDKVRKLLSDSVFMAHNVLFDYSFIRKEFEILEKSFSSKYCCSVKLSKNLYPRFKHHNLDSIIERFNLTCEKRHRAFDDAKAVWDFLKISSLNLGEKRIATAFDSIMKRPSLPINIAQDVLDSLPQGPGVYTFYNKQNAPLYIGKSINIRDRVKSHFSGSKRIPTDMKIAQDIERIETTTTSGELGALLLESTLIKKFQPLYNRQLRFSHKLLALKKVANPGEYNKVSILNLEEIPVSELTDVLGIFKSLKELKQFLRSLAKECNLCLKLLGLEKTRDNCFNYDLDLCKGACKGEESALKYNLRFDEAFYKTKIKSWPFKGPIGIKEKSNKEEVFVIDKWCVLGKLADQSQAMDDISKEYLFDKDTYRILNRYLNGNRDFEVFNISNF